MLTIRAYRPRLLTMTYPATNRVIPPAGQQGRGVILNTDLYSNRRTALAASTLAAAAPDSASLPTNPVHRFPPVLPGGDPSWYEKASHISTLLLATRSLSFVLPSLTAIGIVYLVSASAGGKTSLQDLAEATRRVARGLTRGNLSRRVAELLGTAALTRAWDQIELAQPGLEAAVCTPIIEELIFRKLVYNKLRTALSPVPAALMSSALFGLAHYQNGVYSVIGSSILGIIFSAGYEHLETMHSPMFMHATHNFCNHAPEFAVIARTTCILFHAILVAKKLSNMQRPANAANDGFRLVAPFDH